MNVLRAYIRLIDAVSEWTGRAVCWLIPVMVVILMIEVVMRYFFMHPTLWAYDMAIFLYGYCGILAGAYALKHKAHIVVDVVFNLFRPRVRAICNAATGLLFFFFLALFIKYTWDAGLHALMSGHRSSTQWAPPNGHYRMLLAVGGILLILQGSANWLRDLFMAVTGRELEPSLPEEPLEAME
ncbi:MAG: TRAP transporter small permease subunit [Deltaproteobacteria bacterium]|jgi:TRAP-type mannitol/chloroaromatic compound transport system permease small subunit|nr:TRAP transporter small permease subunit [Deltaproteobacteria bacterium]